MPAKIHPFSTSIRENRPRANFASGDDRGDVVDFQGGDGNDSDMEARIAKLEALAESTDKRLSNIEIDIRDMRKEASAGQKQFFLALVFVALGLAGLMAKGFGWLN